MIEARMNELAAFDDDASTQRPVQGQADSSIGGATI